MESPFVYLDHNATTPLDSSVVDVITKTLNLWGNPSSSYPVGQEARECIEKSRSQVAHMINASSNEIIFVSGGTEANHTALTSAIDAEKSRLASIGIPQGSKPHVITSIIEHDSVTKLLELLRSKGEIELTCIDVNKEHGELDPNKVLSSIKESTCLISIMHANNETGIIMPISKISQELSRINESRRRVVGLPQILLHTDAAQTLGKIRVDVKELGVDYLTIVGHKFYGPRVGALYVKDGTPVSPVFCGGGQERGFRPGTENTPMIAGLGQAALVVSEHLEDDNISMQTICANLGMRLMVDIPGMQINFTEAANRLPNTLSIQVPKGYSGRDVLSKCQSQLMASLGAACHSNQLDIPSRILVASGLSEDEAQRTIRLSIGRKTTLGDVNLAVQILKDALQ